MSLFMAIICAANACSRFPICSFQDQSAYDWDDKSMPNLVLFGSCKKPMGGVSEVSESIFRARPKRLNQLIICFTGAYLEGPNRCPLNSANVGLRRRSPMFETSQQEAFCDRTVWNSVPLTSRGGSPRTLYC